MPTTTVRSLSTASALAWLVVAGYGIWEIVAEDTGDSWQVGYTVFTCALAIASLTSVLAVREVSRSAGRAPLRSIGLGISGLGVVIAAIGAWALPLWMTLLAVGFALVAAADPARRRSVAPLAGGLLLGMAALFGGIAAEVGRVDEHGDHPAAVGIGLVVTAAAMVVSLHLLSRAHPVEVPEPARRAGPQTA